jgi:hypothetical protein
MKVVAMRNKNKNGKIKIISKSKSRDNPGLYKIIIKN